jgi:hypothetical protein
VEYPLVCECGSRVTVTEGSAGTTVPCACGRALRVPSYRHLRSWDGTTPLLPVPLLPVSDAAPRAAVASAVAAGSHPATGQSVVPGQGQSEVSLDSLPPVVGGAQLFSPQSEAVRQMATEDAARREAAVPNMLMGAVICVIGLAITIYSYSAAEAGGGGRYVIAYGAIIAGAIQFVRGLSQLR